MESENKLGKDYKIIKRVGSGGQGAVYLIEDINTGKEYVAKLFEHEENSETEERLNKKISSINPHNTYIIKYIKTEIGAYEKDGDYYKDVKYFIFEYAEKGDLYKYIEITGGFGEKYGKLLIYKILLGIKECHKAGVYHLDIKLQNILLDDKFNPKICDFGFGIDQSGILTNCKGGTENLMPPQILNGDKFTGVKADIFYLGSLLFILVVGAPCFGVAEISDFYYKNIVNKDKKGYFKALENQLKIVNTLDISFKDLIYSMLAYEENDRPENIDKILESKWFDEVRNNKKDLENGLKELFTEKENKVKEHIQLNPDYLKKGEHSFMLDYCRGIGEEIKEIFPKELRPRKTNIKLGMDCFIRFKGNFNYYQYMNILLDKIEKEFGEGCMIDDKKSNRNYECDIIFELNEEENKNDEKELSLALDNKKECIINLELYQSEKEEYILRFLRLSGSLDQFYSKITKMIELVKKSL